MSDKACRYCGLPVTKPRTGRPPNYCSTGCRRAAEFDIRRIARRLESLERRRDELEIGTALQEVESLGAWQVKRQALMVDTVARQIQRNRDRLRDLLDDVGGGDGDAAKNFTAPTRDTRSGDTHTHGERTVPGRLQEPM